ncbi:hypothetical protein FRACYDRAFT_261879 [Fragilariopsis cylindrus CCMP1102]|uniref:Uncharacterized protein n=1 Tax=Fragilariopsis cylindrus CCMP1102 TaxID=635003 RepID=A0A1E7FCP2_9STRA|nr:hypothetical protein FRACYDRAFT_261879 [Fragilariopsis cylindrus CCMP1102]|eukprot:OEU15919.1 hypothetical protein FRACYDRAFT_261879 [Fragilariopsis cylindrus CCMP1102]
MDTRYYHDRYYDYHSNYCDISSISSISRRHRFSTSSSENENKKSTVLPMGIFIDLDNVRPDTLRRQDIKDFLAPLKDFGRRITRNKNTKNALDDNNNDNDNVNDKRSIVCDTKIRYKDLPLSNATMNIFALGNDATFTYISPEERQLELDQEFIPWGGIENNDSNEDEDGDDDDIDNDNDVIAQSGYDEMVYYDVGFVVQIYNDGENEVGEDETTPSSDIATPYMMIRAMTTEGKQFHKIHHEKLPLSLKLGDTSSFI